MGLFYQDVLRQPGSQQHGICLSDLYNLSKSFLRIGIITRASHFGRFGEQQRYLTKMQEKFGQKYFSVADQLFSDSLLTPSRPEAARNFINH